MWANIYSSSVVFINHMAVKLKREADSLEEDFQIFIIKPSAKTSLWAVF